MRRKSGLVSCLGAIVSIVVLTAVVFFPVVGTKRVLVSSDNNIGALEQLKVPLPGSFIGSFLRGPYFGSSGVSAPRPTALLLSLMPVPYFMNWVYAICLVGGGLCLAAFLRRRDCGMVASLFGAVIAFWLGTNLTLVHAGHTSKFATLAFAMLALLAVDLTVRSKSLTWASVAGMSIGLMFIEQQDLALFVGLFVGAYAVFAWWQHRDSRGIKRLLLLAAIALLALCISIPVLIAAYRGSVMDSAAMVSSQSDHDRWEFCTQWSVPPNEIVDLIAPGFTGWYTGAPDGDYWGRTGRSSGWSPESPQGLRNLRLESIYIGAIPIGFAAIAVVGAFAYRRRRVSSGVGPLGVGIESESRDRDDASASRQTQTFFWFGVLVVTLLLSFGRYFPLYRVFQTLPVVASIRNPNKFIHVFQISTAILAAFGLDSLLVVSVRTPKARKLFLRCCWGIALGGCIFLLLALVCGSASGALRGLLVPLVGPMQAQQSTANILYGLKHATVMLFLAAAAVAGLVFVRGRGLRTAISLLVLLLVSGDAVHLSRHYIEAQDLRSLVGPTRVIDTLKKHLGFQRIVLLTQTGIYNKWLSMDFPYYGITAFNAAQMPRMPQVYKVFLSEVGKNPLRLWELAAVGYVMGPTQICAQLLRDENVRQQFEPVMGFNLARSQQGITVVDPPRGQQPEHMIMRYKRGLPRHHIVSLWEVATDESVCARMAAPAFDPWRQAYVSPHTSDGLEPGVGSGSVGRVLKVAEGPRSIRMSVNAEESSLVIVSQRYSPEWIAYVDNECQPLRRCNYLCIGVGVPPGQHDIEFKYEPSLAGLWLQGLGVVGAFMGFAVGLVCVLKRSKSSPPH